jgi:hypothetical protein
VSLTSVLDVIVILPCFHTVYPISVKNESFSIVSNVSLSHIFITFAVSVAFFIKNPVSPAELPLSIETFPLLNEEESINQPAILPLLTVNLPFISNEADGD